MPLVLAAISSVMFGVADFFGGISAKRASAITVVVGVQLIGLVGIAAAVPAFGGSPLPSGIAWGAAAGLCGSTGLVMLYRALATTRMAVAAPVAAIVGALTPVVFGVAIGERPLPLAWAGVALALPAVGMIGAGGRHLPGGDTAKKGAALGVVIGVSGLLTVVPALEGVGLLFGLGLIVWFVWVGILLVRGSVARAVA